MAHYSQFVTLACVCLAAAAGATAAAGAAATASVILQPKVNQLGYLPDGPKRFVIVVESARPGDAFQVLDEAGTVAYEGRLGTAPMDDAASSGEVVLQGDFSPLTRPGRYTVRVNAVQSHPFAISAEVYDRLYHDALRCFYLIRANAPLDDPVTGLAHPAGHHDAEYDTRPGEFGDFTGGWYNAGDYGKWTHEAAFSAAYMMWLYELRAKVAGGAAAGDVISADDSGIPESGNGVPDILDQARWGLEWLLKMQNADGGVYHKVDTEPAFAWGLPPEKDPHPRKVRYGHAFSTVDAATLTAAMAQAARVFRPFDAQFAETCRRAAERSWPWVVAHPDLVQNDPYYVRNETWQERLWALGEMCRLTGDAKLATDFARAVDEHELSQPNWNAPQALGYLAVITAPGLPADLREKVTAALVRAAEARLRTARAAGYGVALRPQDYVWGSATHVAGWANLMLMAYGLTGRLEFRNGAQAQLDYLLGVNALDQCFVTGHGTRRNEHPYHWTWRVYQKTMPGWLTGGPNRYPYGADPPLRKLQETGAPPQKCWLDLSMDGGSWASNEGATDQNAALVFLSGWFATP